MAIDLVDVGGESCEPVAGFVSEVYIAPHDDFTLINDPAALCGVNEGADVQSLVTVATDHTFTVGKGFTKMKGIEEGTNLTFGLLGNTGNKMFNNILTVIVSGSNAELLGFCRQVKNGRYVVLAEEFGSGNFRQVGTKRFPARFEGIDGALEALAEGANQVTFTIQDKSLWPAAIYTGAVTEYPAT